MAPSGRTITEATETPTTSTREASRANRTRRKGRIRHPRRTYFKKTKQQNCRVNKKEEKMKSVLPSVMSAEDSSSKEGDIVEMAEVIDDVSNDNKVCSTPKGQRFRIPEISTCPPAPKKKRMVSSTCSLRSPISFFSHPDLELFFFMTLRDVSV